MAPICIHRSSSVDVWESISMQQPEKFRTNTAADLYTTIPSLFGNVGLIFVIGDLKEVGEVTNIYQQDPIKFGANSVAASTASPVAKEEESEYDDEFLEDLVESVGFISCPWEVYYKEGEGYVDCPF